LDLGDQTSMPTPDKLRVVAGEISRIRGRVQFGNCAIVACSEALFGMLRMFEVFAEEYFRQTHVCRSTQEAQSWLDAHEANARD
jgi:hypothetical protein